MYCSLLSSKGCANGNMYSRGIKLPLFTFIYIKLFGNRAEAEHPCTISSIEPLSRNQSRAILTEASNPENMHPSFVFQGNHKGILHPRRLNVVLDWAPVLFIVHRKNSLLQSSQHWMHFTRAHFTGPRTIKVGVFWSQTLCGSLCPRNYLINTIPFHLKCS